MSVLLRTFLDIALFRIGPENLPASRFLLYATLCVAALVHTVLTWVIFRSSDVVILTLVIDIGVLIVCVWLLLRLIGLTNRFGQTLTALLGTGTLLKLASMPFVYWNATVPAEVPKPALPSAMILAIVLWSFAVEGHILARAMSRPFVIGVLIAIAYFFLSAVLLDMTRVLS